MASELHFRKGKPGAAPGVEHDEIKKLPSGTSPVYVSCIDYCQDQVLVQDVDDLDGFLAWMDVVRDAGLDRKTAIIAGVSVSGGGAVAARLKSVPGVRGIHIFSGGNEPQAATVIQEAGLA